MAGIHHILQANINHCSAAQDLLLQSMAEWLIDIVVVSEPYFIPSSECWISDVDGTVAIITTISSVPLTIVKERGQGYVAALWKDILVIGVYFSPNRILAEFESFISRLGALIRQNSDLPVLLMGDLNAKSTLWGSPATDRRGETLEDWLIITGLLVLNQGTVNTCVRHNGGSIVDVAFATPSIARLVRGWSVQENVETLSDHLYIRFDVYTSEVVQNTHYRNMSSHSTKKWALKSLNKEVFEEASVVQAWVNPPNGSINFLKK